MNLFCPECSSTFDDLELRECPNDGTLLFKTRDQDDPLIGATVDGRFRILSKIGEGGMGTVYCAVQISVDRTVAVKVLKPELTQKKIALERFHRESRLISQLNHPNIVKLIDFGEDRELGLLYLVMEFVQGINLGDLIQRGRLRIPVAIEIIHQCAGALTEPHAMGIIHRDLKPDNIIITLMSDGTLQVKVLDFGIARALEVNTQLTATGMVCGTPSYMAPEQAQNEELDARADLYALGVIFYEMLSGWPPFMGTSSLQIIIKHIQEMPPPLRELLPPTAIPEFLEEFVNGMLSKNRDHRPQDALTLRKKLAVIRRDLKLELPEIGAIDDLEKVCGLWLLPKMPLGGDVHESGPTEALRRETGTDWDTSIYTPEESPTRPTPAPPVGEEKLTPPTLLEARPENPGEARTEPRIAPQTAEQRVATSGGNLSFLSIVAVGLISVLIASVIVVLLVFPEIRKPDLAPQVATPTIVPTEPIPVPAVPSAAPLGAVFDLAQIRVEQAVASSVRKSDLEGTAPTVDTKNVTKKVTKTVNKTVEPQKSEKEPAVKVDPVASKQKQTTPVIKKESVLKGLRSED